MLIKPANWNAPSHIKAFSTTRQCGNSKAPYDSNNLGLHVGDEARDVSKNRQQLMELMQIPKEPFWLNQTHSTKCILVETSNYREADAAVTRTINQPLIILTADCLPILLCSKQGDEIAAIHAGWRGLCQGVVENTLDTMHTQPDSLIAWIGPAICGGCYEIGEEVYQSFTNKNPETQTAFTPSKESKWMANLPLVTPNHDSLPPRHGEKVPEGRMRGSRDEVTSSTKWMANLPLVTSNHDSLLPRHGEKVPEGRMRGSRDEVTSSTKWMANLPLIAQMTLNKLGINSVFQSNLCTFEREKEFFSYRKSAQTGRIGTLIWLSEY